MAADPSVPSRREALKTAAIAATAAAAAGCAEPTPPATAVPGPPPGSATTFFRANELAMVDELGEIIIPTDAHSPGARAAGVAAYIDARLAETWDETVRTRWRDGLRLVDALSRQRHQQPFLQSSAGQRLAIVTELAAQEANPQTPEARFFADLKARVVDAYYSSEIGIKQELEYRGNTSLDEFEGTDVGRA